MSKSKNFTVVAHYAEDNTFEVVGVYPTFAEALEFLKADMEAYYERLIFDFGEEECYFVDNTQGGGIFEVGRIDFCTNEPMNNNKCNWTIVEELA
jgi:hypothetical protein